MVRIFTISSTCQHIRSGYLIYEDIASTLTAISQLELCMLRALQNLEGSMDGFGVRPSAGSIYLLCLI